MLDRIRIVLVRPMRPGNVGAVCRAMVNMGLSDLVLVSPACDLADEQAQGFAARAKPLLQRARIVDSTPAALAGCIATFAASAKGGMYRRQAAMTAAAAADLAVEAAAAGPVAFAFGPEDRGLVMRELLHFDRVVEIPADPEYPVLNLAAAVTVLCYEVRQAWLRAGGRPPWSPREEPVAADERKRMLYAKLFDALDEIGFFDGQQNPEHLKYALRRVFGRANLTANEVDILIGMAQQIRWYADRHPRAGDTPA
ncbi:MAG: RNA methyltransferase [Phycisphaerae bacterium]